MKNNTNVKRLVLAAVYVALGTALGAVSFPIGASKCAPFQHFINIVSAVTLGPVYSVMTAFCISVLRNIIGTGSLLAFPGSMAGALLAGLLYKYLKKDIAAVIGELFGTSVIGGLLAYPVAAFVMGKECALFAYIMPFAVSCAGGCIMAYAVLKALRRTGAFDKAFSAQDMKKGSNINIKKTADTK